MKESVNGRRRRMLPRLKDLSESARTVIITLACESVPLVSLAVAGTAMLNERMVEATEHALGAELDSIGEQLDTVNRANTRALHTVRAQPHTREYCSADATERAARQGELRAMLQSFVGFGEHVSSVKVVSPEGIVWASSLPTLEGADVSARGFITAALSGQEAVGDVHGAHPEAGGGMQVAYSAPLEDEAGGVQCVVVVAADGGVLNTILNSGSVFAGPDSSVDLLDRHGIWLGDSVHEEYVGRPAGALPAEEVAGMVAQGRFRRETASLLSAPIEDEVLFQFARAPTIPVDSPAFWGVAPESGKRSLAIARRTSTVPWTLVARVPESEVLGPARELAAREVGLGVTAILVAAAIGVILVRVQQRRFHAMVAAADAVANGHLDIRIPDPGKDEIGRLASRFNVMADALAHTRADLEARVAERTSALATVNNELEAHTDELFKQRDELMAQQEELQRQALELARRTAEAETADRQKSEILAQIASKLRTPLAGVIAYADLLLGAQSGALNEQQRDFVQAIANAGRMQLSLLNDTTEWSEIEAGHLQISREVLGAEGLLTTARDAVAPQAGRKQLTVRISNSATRPVFADARRVHQILLHLLSNAVRFSPAASTIEVTAEDDGAMVAFEVADRGPGLPEAMWPRLFQPFQQADSPLLNELPGTGLGLAVCKRLVVAQGGGISARPRDGGGLIMRFTLPTMAGSSASTA